MDYVKIIIAGGRTFNDYNGLRRACDIVCREFDPIEIVSGTARGADQLGEKYAKDRGYGIKQFPADWDKYGNSAGYKRNKQMAGYANILIAFWDKKSKGTEHMIDIAEENELMVFIINY